MSSFTSSYQSTDLMSKKAFRSAVKKSLKQIKSNKIEDQSRKIALALKPLLLSHSSVACYMSMEQGEIDTQYVMEWLFKQGKKVYLPRCTTTTKTGQVQLRNGSVAHLTFHAMDSWEKVQSLERRGKYRIREPEPEPVGTPAPLPPHLDVMLVPGVAFDPIRGTRLGHGAGYYDDFFQRYQLQHHDSKPLLVGLALIEQLRDYIPNDQHDCPMDCILSGDGTVYWINK